MPRLKTSNWLKKKDCPLWKLIGLVEPVPDPRNFKELEDFFARHAKPNIWYVVSIVTYFARNSQPVCKSSQFYGSKESTAKKLWIFARTTTDYGFVYSLEQRKKLLPLKEVQPSPVVAGQAADPSVNASNRAACAKAVRKGLNLAWTLGLLADEKEFAQISKKLGKTDRKSVV